MEQAIGYGRNSRGHLTCDCGPQHMSEESKRVANTSSIMYTLRSPTHHCPLGTSLADVLTAPTSSVNSVTRGDPSAAARTTIQLNQFLRGAYMRCDRCHSMMFPVELRDWDGGLMNHETAAWRCFACGEIVDQLICMNRDRSQDHH